MIEWMYTKDYQGPPSLTAAADGTDMTVAMEGQCNCPPRTHDAWGNPIPTIPMRKRQSFGMAVLSSPLAGSTSSTNGAQLLHHARVYVLGDFYGLKDIRELAATKFRDGCAQGCSASKFPEAAHEVYSTTPDADRGLRDIVVDTILRHRKLIDRPEVQSVIQQTELAYDLVMEAHRRGSSL